jgi:hypothetical protein
MRTIPNVRHAAAVGAALALLSGVSATGAQAAELVNIPAISTASWQQTDRTGVAVYESTRRDVYARGFSTSTPPTSVEATTTRLVSTAGATSFSREARDGSSLGTGRDFASLRLVEAQGVKAGAVSTRNPTPGSWLTANLARAAVRGTPQASSIPASIPATTAITGVTTGALVSAARTWRGVPMVELVRNSVKVLPELEPSDGMVTVGPAGAPSPGYLAGTTQYSWTKAAITRLNGDRCRDGEFYLQVDGKGLVTAFFGKMTCKDKSSKSGAEYRWTYEKRVSSYSVKDADVPGPTTPSVAASSLR